MEHPGEINEIIDPDERLLWGSRRFQIQARVNAFAGDLIETQRLLSMCLGDYAKIKERHIY